MVDARYLAWFNEWFDDAFTLTWCRDSTPQDALTAYGVTRERMESATLGELPEFHLVAGHLARGTLVIQANGCPTDDTLTALTQSGPCLSVQWSDFAPPGVVYGAEGQIVVSFDPFDDREVFAAPDWDSVERWVAATPGGTAMWDNDWPLAVLTTADALCEGSPDEEWVRATHLGVRAIA